MPETPPHSENDSTRERFSLDRLPLPEPVRDWLRKRSRRWLWIVPAALSGAVAVAAVVMAIDYINKPKYTRSECMIRMDMYYDNSASELDIRSEQDIIHNYFIKYKINYPLSLAGFGFNPESDTKLYFQFIDNCKLKHIIMQKAVDAFMKKYPGRARIVVSKDVIQPGFDTMVSGGDFWIDGNDPFP